MQMSFLPKINRKATQDKVEHALETARVYKCTGFERREVKNTPSYEPRFHGQTNATSDQVVTMPLGMSMKKRASECLQSV